MRNPVFFLYRLTIFCVSFPVWGQSAVSSWDSVVHTYIQRWAPLAMEEMKRTGIPASIKLAQAIVESAAGTSYLARVANNHFGIKCHGWSGPGVYKDDDAPNECFRKYPSAEASFRDHSEFLRTRRRYAFLFELNPLDYRAWAHGLKKAGYATNPRYPEKLISVIERYQLARYDSIALGLIAEPQRQPSPMQTGKEHWFLRDSLVNLIKVVVFPSCPVEGGSIYQIVAQRRGIRESRLRAWNENLPDSLVCQLGYLFVQPRRKRSLSRKTWALPEPLSPAEIAHRTGVRLSALYEWNGWDPEKISLYRPLPAGTTVYLQRTTQVRKGFHAGRNDSAPVSPDLTYPGTEGESPAGRANPPY